MANSEAPLFRACGPFVNEHMHAHRQRRRCCGLPLWLVCAAVLCADSLAAADDEADVQPTLSQERVVFQLENGQFVSTLTDTGIRGSARGRVGDHPGRVIAGVPRPGACAGVRLLPRGGTGDDTAHLHAGAARAIHHQPGAR